MTTTNGPAPTEMFRRFRKKPVVISAIQWTGDNLQSIDAFFGDEKGREWTMREGSDSLFIETLEGEHEGRIGDWIIKGVAGEFYPCKPDIFEQTYDEVTAT